MPLFFSRDAKDDRQARLDKEKQQANELAQQVIQYLIQQLNNNDCIYIESYKFNRKFPKFKNSFEAHKHVYCAGLFMRKVVGGEYEITRIEKPSPYKGNRFGGFMISPPSPAALPRAAGDDAINLFCSLILNLYYTFRHIFFLMLLHSLLNIFVIFLPYFFSYKYN